MTDSRSLYGLMRSSPSPALEWKGGADALPVKLVSTHTSGTTGGAYDRRRQLILPPRLGPLPTSSVGRHGSHTQSWPLAPRSRRASTGEAKADERPPPGRTQAIPERSRAVADYCVTRQTTPSTSTAAASASPSTLGPVGTGERLPSLLPVLREAEGELGDDYPEFARVAELVVETQFGRVSMLQRRLWIGFAGANQIADQLERYGIVGLHRAPAPGMSSSARSPTANAPRRPPRQVDETTAAGAASRREAA